jgi:hypothetical protein
MVTRSASSGRVAQTSVRHICLKTLTARQQQDAAIYGVLTGSICNSIKAAALTV